ncbi:hypothetical protein [Staphylococcus condimenti]|nr:hypothetical protein [Staphylococcus condimenti]
MPFTVQTTRNPTRQKENGSTPDDTIFYSALLMIYFVILYVKVHTS